MSECAYVAQIVVCVCVCVFAERKRMAVVAAEVVVVRAGVRRTFLGFSLMTEAFLAKPRVANV